MSTATARRVARPATDRQAAFIRTLLAERDGNPAAEALRDQLNAHRDDATLTTAVASAAIDALLALPRNPAPAPAAAAPAIPTGSYAIETGDASHPVRFYKVTNGRRSGIVFLDELASDNRFKVSYNDPRYQTILESIAADPAAAGQRYSVAFKHCARCRRGLTDKDSRRRGYGPDCWALLGFTEPADAELEDTDDNAAEAALAAADAEETMAERAAHTNPADHPTDPVECLDRHGPDTCRGPVEYRTALSASGRSFPRCDLHWDRRLDEQDRINDRYPTHAPRDWSPLDAGEAWGEDDY